MVVPLDPRVVIAQRPTQRDHLHGAWWPRTTDLARELAPLLKVAVARFGSVPGILLNRDEWPGAPLTTGSASAGKVKISWYGLSEPHVAVLYCGNARRITLLVLAPSLDEPVALTATLMAATPGNSLRADQVRAAATVRVAEERPTGS